MKRTGPGEVAKGPQQELFGADTAAPVVLVAQETVTTVNRAVAKPAERQVWSVGELTQAVKEVLEEGFSRVTVRGEVSGFRGPHARGHLYFSLKDAEASIESVVWATTAARMKFRLKEGMAVVVEGHLDLYKPHGKYKLIIDRMEPEGEGALALAFQQLKERLTEEGLMGEQRLRPPRPLPYWPRRIGIITSRSGAALHDFLRVLHTRNPRLSVLLADARMEGAGAAADVVRALGRLARTDVDVIVITRGGGSVESLWTFNEESVARAIHASPVPVVSAIGHETDFSIADFVSDFRAPTPSAAAERLAPVLRELELALRNHQGRLAGAMSHRILARRERLRALAARIPDPRRVLSRNQLRFAEDTERLVRRTRALLQLHQAGLKGLQERLARQSPQGLLSARRQQLAKLKERLVAGVHERVRRERKALGEARLTVERQTPLRRIALERRRVAMAQATLRERVRSGLAGSRQRFHGFSGRLDAMSPLKVMSRGYAVAFRQRDGQLIRSASEVAPGDALEIRLAGPGAQSLSDCEEIAVTVTGTRLP